MPSQTREQLIEKLRVSQQQVVDALAATENIQDWQREPAEWSFRTLAAHFAAVESQCHLRRLQEIAKGGSPHLNGFNSSFADLQSGKMKDSLREWIITRQTLVAYVEDLNEEQLEYVGFHEKIGAITVLDALQEILDQDRGNFRHVCQLIVDYYEDNPVVLHSN